MAIRVIITLALFFVGSTAMCGSYTVSYAGGQAGGTGPSGQSWSDDYGTNSNGFYGGSGKSSDYPNSAPATGSASSEGSPISITLNWDNQGNPNDLPPPYVIVHETSTATWLGGIGYCDNGLEDPHIQDIGFGISTGTSTWLLPNPGNTISWTRFVRSSADLGTLNPGGLRQLTPRLIIRRKPGQFQSLFTEQFAQAEWIRF